MTVENPAEPLRQAAEALNTCANGARSSASGRWYVATKQGGYPPACDALHIANALAARRGKLVEEVEAATEAGNEELASAFEMLLAVLDDRERLHAENDELARRALAAETRVHDLEATSTHQWRIRIDGHPNSGCWIDVADGDFQNLNVVGRLEFRAKPTTTGGKNG